jgi:hypothetical protein
LRILEIRVGETIVVWKLDRLARFTRDQNAIAILSAYSNVTAAFCRFGSRVFDRTPYPKNQRINPPVFGAFNRYDGKS